MQNIVGMRLLPLLLFVLSGCFLFTPSAFAALTLTGGGNATTTPNVATSITGFQIVGPAASTTPVKLRATNGILNLAVVSGVTMSGNGSGTVNLSGTVANLNTALSTLTYTRGSVGSDTLEVSLVEPTEVFFEENGHLYQFIPGNFTWFQARDAAAARTAYGASGYLATITSAAENNFVYQRISGDGWLGANDIDTEKRWIWATGPEAGTHFFQENPSGGGGSAVEGRFHAWANGEPNDHSSGEDCGYIYASQGGTWNDFPCNAQQGYVVEFGAEGDLPVVVAQNIAIVTADVPALTTLSPANGNNSFSPSGNLVMNFSKVVTKQTGNILIRKVLNDELVASIDVASDLVTGTASTTVVINPENDLEEGVQYYVTVPGTAFSDNSANFFAGINNNSTWVFTTSDETAPVISNMSVVSATTTSTLSWHTNELASTRVWYSADLSFASSTSETNTSPRVTTHEVLLSNLVPCTLYQYRVVSRDSALNTATSSTASFITTGCPAFLIPSVSTTTLVSVNTPTTVTLSEDNRTLSVSTPANFTATSSSIIIQIKSLPSDTVIEAIGKPTNSLRNAAAIVFDVTALIDNETVLDSFDAPVTISYTYTPDDIYGIDESSLWLYHYHNDNWEALDDCDLDMENNSISCTTESFSIFGIFGNATVEASKNRSTGITLMGRINNLIATGNLSSALELLREYLAILLGRQTTASESIPSFSIDFGTTSVGERIFVRDLKLGMQGEDVKKLQELLINEGYKIPAGNTGYFGLQTQYALDAYQQANNIAPRGGYFGPITRSQMSWAGVSGLWW
jgi:hypothetical protein